MRFTLSLRDSLRAEDLAETGIIIFTALCTWRSGVNVTGLSKSFQPRLLLCSTRDSRDGPRMMHSWNEGRNPCDEKARGKLAASRDDVVSMHPRARERSPL